MQRRSILLAVGAATVGSSLLAACGGGNDPDIVQIAQSNPDLSILVEAVAAAGLVDTLKSPGPFTVFAPTNAAFVSLLGELGVTKDALLANNPFLTAVLTYHVLSGRDMTWPPG